MKIQLSVAYLIFVVTAIGENKNQFRRSTSAIANKGDLTKVESDLNLNQQTSTNEKSRYINIASLEHDNHELSDIMLSQSNKDMIIELKTKLSKINNTEFSFILTLQYLTNTVGLYKLYMKHLEKNNEYFQLVVNNVNSESTSSKNYVLKKTKSTFSSNLSKLGTGKFTPHILKLFYDLLRTLKPSNEDSLHKNVLNNFEDSKRQALSIKMSVYRGSRQTLKDNPLHVHDVYDLFQPIGYILFKLKEYKWEKVNKNAHILKDKQNKTTDFFIASENTINRLNEAVNEITNNINSNINEDEQIFIEKVERLKEKSEKLKAITLQHFPNNESEGLQRMNSSTFSTFNTVIKEYSICVKEVIRSLLELDNYMSLGTMNEKLDVLEKYKEQNEGNLNKLEQNFHSDFFTTKLNILNILEVIIDVFEKKTLNKENQTLDGLKNITDIGDLLKTVKEKFIKGQVGLNLANFKYKSFTSTINLTLREMKRWAAIMTYYEHYNAFDYKSTKGDTDESYEEKEKEPNNYIFDHGLDYLTE